MPSPIEYLRITQTESVLKTQLRSLEMKLSDLFKETSSNPFLTPEKLYKKIETTLHQQLQFYFLNRYATEFYIKLQVMKDRNQVGLPYQIVMSEPYSLGGGAPGSDTLIPVPVRELDTKHEVIAKAVQHMIDQCAKRPYAMYSVKCDLLHHPNGTK